MSRADVARIAAPYDELSQPMRLRVKSLSSWGTGTVRWKGWKRRVWLEVVGLLGIAVGLLVGFIGPLSWVPFPAGFVCVGVGLMVDSKAQAAPKAAARMPSRGY